MINQQELIALTNQLYDHTITMSDTYKQARKTGEKGDFFNDVKPFVDTVQALTNIWRDEAIKWVTTNRPKNLHSSQIESASEQLEMLAVQSFFPETSFTRYQNYLQSVRYVLNVLQAELRK